MSFTRSACLLAVVAMTTTFTAFADIQSYVVTNTGQFGTFDVTTGAATVIANEGVSLDGIAQGANGSLYTIDANNNVYTLNATTGAETLVGNAGALLTTFGGNSNGSLFALDAAENLYSIDPNTGIATLIGSTGLPTVDTAALNFGNSLSGDTNQLFYTLQIYSGGSQQPSELYSINPSTAATTLIGPTGTNAILGSGYLDGNLYGFSYGNGDVFQLNTSTGAGTDTGVSAAGTLQAIFGATSTEAISATPEPNCEWLLALALPLTLIAAKRFARQ